MIKSVTLKNFRGLTELTVPLASITMLTGVNGAGKTSVLEGLYCLFSHSRLDVSPLSRYNKSLGFSFNQIMNQAANIPAGFTVRQNYNYKLFWDECPTFGNHECSVDAVSDNNYTWAWSYRKAGLSDLDTQITTNNPFPVDGSSEFALFNWHTRGKTINSKTKRVQNINEKFQRVQLLSQDGGLYLLPFEAKPMSICQYLDFASLRIQPQKLSFQTAKQLTAALDIINPNITDVRLKDIVSGLSIILGDNIEVSLGTIGNGAVTWAGALIAIYEIVDLLKQQPDKPAIILVDEMGAGIHYSIMLDIWKYLDDFNKQNRNLQFVFSSHSDDCIRAFCETFSLRDDVSIVRLHQAATGGGTIPTEYRKESFQNISDGEWEVRG